MGRRTVVTDETYSGYAIQSSNGGCYQQIMDGYNERLAWMMENCTQVVAIHLVVTWPDGVYYEDANATIGYILNSIKRSLNRDGVIAQYGWVREVGNGQIDNKPHYHIGILVDGHEVQSGYGLALSLNSLFTKQLNIPDRSVYVRCIPPQTDYQSEFNLPNPTALKLRVNAPGAAMQRENLMNWLSYHAKVETKDGTAGVRTYGFSQVPSTPR